MSDETQGPIEFHLPVSAQQAGRDAGGNHIKATGRLLNVVRDQLSSLVKLPSKEEVLEAAGQAFDTYIAPINIPYVPDAIEVSVVDPALKQVFVNSVGRVYDALAKRQAA